MQLPGLQLGEVEDVVEQAEELLAGAAGTVQVVLPFRAHVVLEQFQHPQHAVQGGADLVAGAGEEVEAGAGQAFRPVARLQQLPLGLELVFDVHAHQDQGGVGAVQAAQAEEVDDGGLAPQQARLELTLALPACLFDGGAGTGAVGLVQQIQEGAVLQAPVVEAAQAGEAVIPPFQLALAVDAQDDPGHEVDHRLHLGQQPTVVGLPFQARPHVAGEDAVEGLVDAGDDAHRHFHGEALAVVTPTLHGAALAAAALVQGEAAALLLQVDAGQEHVHADADECLALEAEQAQCGGVHIHHQAVAGDHEDGVLDAVQHRLQALAVEQKVLFAVEDRLAHLAEALHQTPELAHLGVRRRQLPLAAREGLQTGADEFEGTAHPAILQPADEQQEHQGQEGGAAEGLVDHLQAFGQQGFVIHRQVHVSLIAVLRTQVLLDPHPLRVAWSGVLLQGKEAAAEGIVQNQEAPVVVLLQHPLEHVVHGGQLAGHEGFDEGVGEDVDRLPVHPLQGLAFLLHPGGDPEHQQQADDGQPEQEQGAEQAGAQAHGRFSARPA